MKKSNILIVDDMGWVYESARIKLENFCNLSYAKTEREAKRLMKKNKYDLIIADYYLGPNSPDGGLKLVQFAHKIGLNAVLMSKENHRKEAKEKNVKFIFKKNLVKYIKNWKNER